MTVVAAFDLHDLVPAREGPGGPDGVHGGLGAGVGEAPQRQAEALRQQLGHLGVQLARRDVERAVGELGLDGLDDERVQVPHEQGAEAHVEVDVAVAVQVLQPGALGPGGHDRMGVVELERRRHAQGKGALRPVGGLLGAGGALGVPSELLSGERPGAGTQVDLHGIGGCHRVPRWISLPRG
jgi:hypothetical protein